MRNVGTGSFSAIWEYVDSSGYVHHIESAGYYAPWGGPMWISKYKRTRTDYHWALGTIACSRGRLIERLEAGE